ncbi:MAG TPA: hypothetical protein VIV11_36620 [Kofleriaceae bacterium]
MCRACVVLVLLVACNDKQDTKATPSPSAEVKPPAPPPVEAPKQISAAEPTKPAIKPTGGINTAAEYEQKAFDLTDKLTAVFAGAGTNCEKLADNLEIFVATHKAAFEATDQFEAVNPSAEDDLDSKLQSRAQALIQKSRISMQACQNHAGVKAALAKIPD